MARALKLVTAEDLYQLPGDFRCELIDGVLIELSPPAPEHGGVAARFTWRIAAHAEPAGLGRVLTEVGFILRRNPDTVRAPDVAFIRSERIPATGLPRTFWELAPDLVVEVVSPSNTASQVQSKVREWLEGGSRLVWVADPPRKTIEIVRSLTDRVRLTIDDTLDGGDVLPGFTCPVAQFFD